MIELFTARRRTGGRISSRSRRWAPYAVRATSSQKLEQKKSGIRDQPDGRIPRSSIMTTAISRCFGPAHPHLLARRVASSLPTEPKGALRAWCNG